MDRAGPWRALNPPPTRNPDAGAAPMTSLNDIRKPRPCRLSRLFREARARDRALLAAGAAQRPDADVRQCRHGAVQERLYRGRASRLCARRHQPEMRAGGRQAQRPRQCRLHGAASYLLRDAGKFLLRRLFQGDGDPAGLGSDHQGIRAVQGSPAGHRLSRRRRGRGDLEEICGPAGRADHPHPDRGQFLVDGAHGALRPVLGDLLRSWRACAGRPAGQSGRGRRPLHRDLEPRLHAVRAVRERAAREPAAPLDRHRHGA